jgi:pyruvate-formate lyase-activating enzyme
MTIRRAMEHMVESEGNVKFDLKAFDLTLYKILAGYG